MDLQLKGKKVLVTGSTAGIGFASARAFSAEGASVIINGRTQERVDNAIREIRKSQPSADLSGVASDVSNAAGCAKLIQAVPDVDVLVNNMGIFEPKPFEQIPDEDWLRFFEANVMSGVRLSRHLSLGHAQEELGKNSIRLKRVRCANSCRDDSLRHDEDGASCHRSGHCGVSCRDWHHREQHTAWANSLRGSGNFRCTNGRWRRFCGVRSGILQVGSSLVSSEAV
jgi:NAD(P)-dependent dehydrogenase (short-subunit alcohol dehydrogenase family)